MKKSSWIIFFHLFLNSLFAIQLPERNEIIKPSNSINIELYNIWQNLDNAISNPDKSEQIALYQNDFLMQLEKEKQLSRSMYDIQSKLQNMETACKNLDQHELSRLITDYYLSMGLIYRKNGTVFTQLIILMGLLILTAMILLFFYQFAYASRIETEKILKATNKGQEEERRRIALELHDSVAQQMRYVSILAEKIPDSELSKEIKENQSECIESIRNACYVLSSINMEKGNFPATLKHSIDSFQKRTGINTTLVITPDVDFDSLPQITFHHIFRIIMELLTNIEKHARATEVTVLIRNPAASDKFAQGLVIFISDDGKGMNAKTLEMMNSKKIESVKSMHFGLQNIKLRLKEINGTIKFLSEEGEGTEVKIGIGK